MIERLKEFDRNIAPYDYKEPLLEYADEVANHFWGDYDPAKYVLEDGTEVDIIVKGRFVLPGTEELNAMIDDN